MDLEAAGCRAMALDVTDETSMAAAVAAIEAEHGAIAGLVNNAGYSQSGAVEAVPLERVRAQFETNVFGLMRLSQLVIPRMRRVGRGHIVHVSSMGGTLVFPGGGVYHATKYAVEALGDAMRFELAGFGIRVVLIQPGLIQTDYGAAATRAMASIRAAEPDVYSRFHAEIARMTRDATGPGKAGALTGTAEDVARVIERALRSPLPKPRYTVAWSATLFMALRRILGDRGWDWFVGQRFPGPGR
jgi:NAD(P)-dependent dehydrogenase (short-subunit alcohol dehydrogenase family)